MLFLIYLEFYQAQLGFPDLIRTRRATSAGISGNQYIFFPFLITMLISFRSESFQERGLTSSGQVAAQDLSRLMLEYFLLGVSDFSCKPLELKYPVTGSGACSLLPLRKVPEKRHPALRPR